MTQGTTIQWTDATWNVVTGCTRVSPGCARCYIERTPPFRMSGRRFARVGTEETTGVTLHWDRLEKPPRGPKVFTPSLGDLFHDEVPYNFVDATLAAMALHPDRQFQILTKRPEEALHYFATGRPWERVSNRMFILNAYSRAAAEVARRELWPLPNVWLGVSIENARYTWRADVLREIPAAIRFVSAEPLLGSLYPPASTLPDRPDPGLVSDPQDAERMRRELDAGRGRNRAPLDLSGIDWVIIGGESGPKSRPFHVEYAREIIRACIHKPECALNPYATATAYVRAHRELCDCGSTAVFVKQLGAKPIELVRDPGKGHTGLVPYAYHLTDRKGGDWDEWPADLKIREFPTLVAA